MPNPAKLRLCTPRNSYVQKRERIIRRSFRNLLKGNSRFGPSNTLNQRSYFQFQRVNFSGESNHPICYHLNFLTQGKQTLGRQRYMFNQDVCKQQGDGQGGAILNVGSALKLTYCAKFSLGQFYVAKTRSYGRVVSGKILGNYNLSFARNRQN